MALYPSPYPYLNSLWDCQSATKDHYYLLWQVWMTPVQNCPVTMCLMPIQYFQALVFLNLLKAFSIDLKDHSILRYHLSFQNPSCQVLQFHQHHQEDHWSLLPHLIYEKQDLISTSSLPPI